MERAHHPGHCQTEVTSPESWCYHAWCFLDGQAFDEVLGLAGAFAVGCGDVGSYRWITAAVRVGLIMESLLYSEEEYRRWPHLRERAGFVERQVKYMTHVLTADECDADVFNQAGAVQAVFWPSAVPSRFYYCNDRAIVPS